MSESEDSQVGNEAETDVQHAREQAASIALISAGLGGAFIGSLVYVLASRPTVYQPPIYLAALSLFHFLEYWVTARYNAPKASRGSFLFNNGKAYNISHAIASTEALILFSIWPNRAANGWRFYVSISGLIISIIGQVLRSMAMIHAATNFSHVISRAKEQQHELVQTGIYSFSRHPSYTGFFYWAVGLQVFLLNPISTIGFVIVLWRFFNERIKDEEAYLMIFFGQKYQQYKSQTPTRIPFIP